ncbi:MAG TPA: glycoside hydrolase family 127 protein [Verrucomicrobiae bacterium]|nr:glycoside hydrolase family 127 protein [Verrucomicrobiae bacterium]
MRKPNREQAQEAKPAHGSSAFVNAAFSIRNFIWLSTCLLSAFLPSSLSAAEPGVVDTSASPHAAVRTVGLDEVRWTRGFWADRFEVCRMQTLPAMGRLMEGTNYTQFFRNFEIAAGLAEGVHRGAPFNDGDFYKLIEAASAACAVTNDDYFDRSLDRAISVIAQAQRADGYLHTPVLIAERNGDTNAVPFQDRNNFELYNLGHLMTAACVHYRATGKTNLLAVACKAADFLCATFSNATPEAARSSVCPSHYMGLVELYRATREPRYLELARKLFALRSRITDGGDDNQDRIPFDQQTEAMGHAVRANYLYAGAADLFMETGDQTLWEPLGPIWTNVIQQKMYITGGCGALYDGASPDGAEDQKSITRVHQAYGRNYQLPNTTAHCETCANIANVLWNWRMFLATGDARFMDVVERALYNSVLSGGSLDGTNFFYTNPLRVVDPMPTRLRWPRTRVPFLSAFCCPPNLARTVAEVGGYAYGKSAGAVWINLYGSSTLATRLPDGPTVKLTQETDYPWNGQIRITINECGDMPFALKLRIPGWADGTTVRVNRQPLDASRSPTGYLEIHRAWRCGDLVELDLPLPARLIEANPLVEEDRNQVAVQRGPIVYCLESPDLPQGVQLADLAIPAGIRLVPRYDPALLQGVAVLEGRALVRQDVAWNGLYRVFHPAPARIVPVRFIPYFAWANRGPSEMSVWLPIEGYH